MNDINVPIQEEVDPKEVLDDSAERLALIASKLAEIFRTGFDAGFIGAKTKALLEAYKQDVIDYINEQLDLIVKGESADGVLNTIKELREALNNDADAFGTLLDKISESNVAIATNREGITKLQENTLKSRAKTATNTLRLYACDKTSGDHMVIPNSITGTSESSAAATIENYPYYVSTIIKRDTKGRASVMNPTNPKHIANKEYVDGEVEGVKSSVNALSSSVDATNTKITNMLTSSRPEHRVTYASYACKSPYLVYPSDDDALMSKEHVEAKIATEISKVINGAPEALNTLKEISEALNNDADAVASLTKTIADNKVAAEKYTDDAISKIDIPNVDLSNYAKVEDGSLTVTDDNYAKVAVKALSQGNNREARIMHYIYEYPSFSNYLDSGNYTKLKLAPETEEDVTKWVQFVRSYDGDEASYAIYGEHNKPPVDTELSDTSENPVQNKAVKSYIDEHIEGINDILSNCVGKPGSNGVSTYLGEVAPSAIPGDKWYEVILSFYENVSLGAIYVRSGYDMYTNLVFFPGTDYSGRIRFVPMPAGDTTKLMPWIKWYNKNGEVEAMPEGEAPSAYIKPLN